MANLKKNSRQKTTLDRLEDQLKKNTKREKIDRKTSNNLIPLTDNDVIRIKKQIDTLKKLTMII